MWFWSRGDFGLESFVDDPPQGPWPKWFGGAVIPGLIAACTTRILLTGHATFGGRRGRVELSGIDATMFGVALLGFGVLLHCHYFWGNTTKLADYSYLGKVVGLLTFVVGLGFVALHVLASW
ncbi:MAG: hypothetical protein HZA46_09440 [Planctomycetales bacterium]|nr:hypothetical protein [Planctomycetales bacterium]